MLPKEHFTIGIIFVIILKVLCPWITPFELLLIAAANFLIDVDHYLASCIRCNKWLTLKESYRYHDNVLAFEKDMHKFKLRGDFHFFHTVEFHIFILLLMFVWLDFWFILCGMLLHSFTDYVYLMLNDKLYRREYWFVRWLKRKLNNK